MIKEKNSDKMMNFKDELHVKERNEKIINN